MFIFLVRDSNLYIFLFKIYVVHIAHVLSLTKSMASHRQTFHVAKMHKCRGLSTKTYRTYCFNDFLKKQQSEDPERSGFLEPGLKLVITIHFLLT